MNSMIEIHIYITNIFMSKNLLENPVGIEVDMEISVTYQSYCGKVRQTLLEKDSV